MKKVLFYCLFSLTALAGVLQAQQISVKSFQRLENDLSARTSGIRDQNGEVPAIIKVVSTEKDFTFDGDGNGIVKTEPQKGEIWVYVPHDSRFITIKHDKLGVLRNYKYPEKIEEGMVYEMELTTGKMTTVVQEDMGGQYLILQVKPENAVVQVDNATKSLNGGILQELLTYGTHDVTVMSPPWYKKEVAKVTINRDGPTEKKIELKEAFGYIEVNSEPAGARVFIDNDKGKPQMGQTPFKSDKILEGTCTVRTRASLYHADVQDVKIKAGETKTLNVVLKPAFGTLVVNSSPESGADVFINDEKVGTTPYRNEKQESGDYFLKVEKAGFTPAMQSVTIEDQKTTTVNLSMSSNFGKLIVETDAEATIWVDGEEKGKGRWEGNVSNGLHSIEATKNGHHASSKSVNIKDGETLTEKLDKPIPMLGLLNVSSTPPKATIYIDGKVYGETPKIIKDLLVGSHEMEVKLEGYKTEKRRVSIVEGKISNTQVTLMEAEKYGSLSITSTPPGAKILLDGKDHGVTPKTIEDLKGSYMVEISKEGYKVEKRTVEVAIGQTARVQVELKEVIKNYVETAFGMNMEMVYVEGGSFVMGCTSEQGGECESDESPTRRVSLHSYYIGATEVTQGQWEKVMGTSIYQQWKKAGFSGNPTKGIGQDYPMYCVSWDEAMAFCRKLSRQTGKTYTLPAEAQWEFAARGGNKDDGTKYSGSYSVDVVAWYTDNSGGTTHQVKTKRANGLGIYDMSGNVWEWCKDWKGNYNTSDTQDPQGPSSGSYRVFRGGSWYYSAQCCRVADRGNNTPSFRNSGLGFRVVMLP